MRLVLMVALAILVIPIGINAEQYCQVVNRNRGISNAKPLAAKINELLTIKGIKYKTTPKEINSTMKNYCRDNPNASADMAHNHLMQIVDILASLENKR